MDCSYLTREVRFPSGTTNSGQSGSMDHDSFDHGHSFFSVSIVLAISTSSLSRSSDSIISGNAVKLFHLALFFREFTGLPNTVIGVQSILFLIQFAALNPSVLDAWYLIGVGMRTCVDLGLHQDPHPQSSVLPSLLETRRRLWWSMYSVDRSMSLSCGRPTEISDSVIRAELPSFRIGGTATEVEISGYLQRYRILQLQSLIYDKLNESSQTRQDGSDTVSNMRQRLSTWKSNNSSQHYPALMESEFLMGNILLYRPSRLIPNRSHEDLQALWRSSVDFARIYRQLAESNGIFYVQIGSEKAYWTGLAMLFSYWKLGPGTLRLSELWIGTRDIIFILQALSERWEEGKVLAAKFEESTTKVIRAMEVGQATVQEENDGEYNTGIPEEVMFFHTYSSLTSIWTAGQGTSTGGSSTHSENQLQGLIAEMGKN